MRGGPESGSEPEYFRSAGDHVKTLIMEGAVMRREPLLSMKASAGENVRPAGLTGRPGVGREREERGMSSKPRPLKEVPSAEKTMALVPLTARRRGLRREGEREPEASMEFW